MKYSPLTVHCTSLCLDVVYRPEFSQLNEGDIKGFYPEVYEMVYERLQTPIIECSQVDLLSESVTRKIIAVLCYLKDHPECIDSGRILYALDELIGLRSTPLKPQQI
jgi:hypothetical protein